jgi:hypothetical protein
MANHLQRHAVKFRKNIGVAEAGRSFAQALIMSHTQTQAKHEAAKLLKNALGLKNQFTDPKGFNQTLDYLTNYGHARDLKIGWIQPSGKVFGIRWVGKTNDPKQTCVIMHDSKRWTAIDFSQVRSIAYSLLNLDGPSLQVNVTENSAFLVEHKSKDSKFEPIGKDYFASMSEREKFHVQQVEQWAETIAAWNEVNNMDQSTLNEE